MLGTGTSQGVPVIACDCEVCTSLDYRDKRLRSSVFIETSDVNLVIDTGPDFRQQMLRERIKKVDALLFTHEHKDHTAGLDDVRSFNFKHKMDMPVYAADRVIDQLKQEFAYAFQEEKYPGVPRIVVREITNEPFQIEGTAITPINLMHHKLPIFGFRIGDFAYITDANHIPESEFDKLKNLKVLILNALQKEPHISHFTLDQAIEMAQKIGAGKTCFTHISHKLGTHEAVNAGLPEGIELAWDGLQFDL